MPEQTERTEQTERARVGERLSPRELEALGLASQGQTNGEIAVHMGISIHAVKFHMASVYRKLGVTNRTEAAVRYLEARLERVEAAG